jgi:hypothetical protein
MQRVNGTGSWSYTGDLPRQHVTVRVDSDGPQWMVKDIGDALVAESRHLPIPPTRPEQVYVRPAVHTLRVGKAVRFWVLVAFRPNTYPGAADFDFTLQGGWARPRTVTPDGTQGCGGDNIAGQPYVRHGRWVFNWGDCSELGLVLQPTTVGPHVLVINSYTGPLLRNGTLDTHHEHPAPGGGYVWRGTVQP